MRKLCAAVLAVLMTFSLLSSPPASSTVAQAATTSKPKTSPAHPVRGVTFKVSGRISTHVARPVRLQRKSGSSWVTVASGKTTSSGRYSFRVTSTWSSTRFRVYAPKVKIKKKTYRRLVSPSTTVRTATVTPIVPMAREKFTVVESLRKRGARTAVLQRRVGRKWVTISKARSRSNGIVTFTASLSGSSKLRVVAPKTTIKKKRLAKITLPTFTVRVAGQAGAMSLPSSGTTGQALTAHVRYTPARAGRAVELQQYKGSRWVRVALGYLDATGRATLAVAPTETGTAKFRANALPYKGAPARVTAVATATIASGIPKPSIVLGALSVAVTGEDYDAQLSVAGGTAPYTWSATGLPEGMSLDKDGKLSGTPTEPGIYTVHLTVTDATGQSAEATSQFEVKPVVGIDTETLPKAIASEYYEAEVVGIGGTEGYTWQATGLPAGLTMSEDGTISGTTDEVGDHPVTLTITDAKTRTATKDFTLTVTEALALTTDTLAAGVTNTAYEHTLTATGGLEPYTWTASGLPAGLTIDPATGVLSGSPTEAGTFAHVEITVTDDNGYDVTKTFTMAVALEFSITTTSLPNGVVGTLYTETPLATSTGTAPFTWTATHLPDGLALDPTSGVISGTPTQAGTFNEIAVSVTDADHRTAQTTFTVVIAPAIHITTTDLPTGVVGTDYPQTSLAAAGGNTDSIFWSAENLPDGLTLNGNTGVLTGTPTTAGTADNVTFTVTDADGKSAQKTLTVVIAPAVHITTTSLPNGVVGTAYTATLAAADGNSGDYTWASTTLPDGLTLSSSGVLSGTPTTAGVYDTVTITVTDAADKTAETTLTLTVIPAVHITTTTLPAGVVGTLYTQTTLTAADGTPDYTWTATDLPLGLTLSSAGVLSGTPTQDGTFTVAVTATDSNGQEALTSLTLTIAKAVHIATTVMPNAVVGTGYQANLVAAGGNTPYVWDVENLPAGMHLNREFGTVSGTPSQAGTFEDVTFTVTDGTGKVAQKTVTITVAPAVHITTTTLPDGVAGTQYPATTLTAADGNPGDYTWASTTLPDGLTLSSSGVLSGTPTTAGVYDTVTITVTDAADKTAETTFSITVNPAVHITTTDLPNGVAGTQYPATTLTAADGNPGDYTWASTTLPDGLTLSSSGVLSGTPTTTGVYNAVTITVTDAADKSANHTFTITVTPAVHITTTTIPDGVAEAPYSVTLAAADGTPGYTWASNDLPAGLHLDANTGVISGTPATAAPIRQIEVTVTDSQGKEDMRRFDFKIGPPLRISTQGLPDGVVDVAYGHASLSAIDGHGAPYTWSSSTLPAGLSISSDGSITGTPTTAGTFDAVTITVTDAAGVTAEATFTITIAPPVHITTAALPGGVVGTDYSATLAAADGQSDTYHWQATNLPDGLTLDDSTGKISGVPTTAKLYDPVTITVLDGALKTAQANFTISITPAVHVTTTDLPNGVAGTQYPATTLTAADGNPGDYTWTSTTLPDGLALSSDGILSGTPTTAGTYDAVKIAVTDVAGKTTEANFTITVTPAVHITTAALPDAVLEEAYPTTTLAAADGNGGFTWSATGLPEGVTLNADTGALSGTPTQSGTFDAAKITVTDAKGGTASRTFTITVHAVVAITTTNLPDIVVNEQYSATLAGLGGTKPYTWAVTGLPQGLSLNTSTGEITGTPTETGSFALGVTLTDDHTKVATTSLTLTVRAAVGITTTSLPGGVVGTIYNATLSASGGTAPYRWTTTTLPSTLTLSEAGAITGTPDTAGSFSEITITVTDAHGTTATFSPTLTIVPAIHITTTSLPGGVVDTNYSATLTSADGNGTATWSSTPLPDGLALDADTGKITGKPTTAGNTEITFTATDPKAATATWTTTITVIPAVHITTTSLPGGIVGDDYSASLAADDGNGTATWSSTELPAGLTLDANTGAISGNPTAAGDTEVTFTATDPETKTDTWTTTITVIPAVHVTTTELPSVEAGDAYPETTLTAADGTPGYTWTSTTLPEGLTLTEAGVLSGTPTTAGDTTVTFTATDHNGKTATTDLTITITAAAHLSSTLAIGVVGGDYTTTLTATGGTAPYTITATDLPAGLSFTDGVISGTPTTSGTNTPIQISITDGRGKTTTTTPGLTVVKAVPQSAGATNSCAITSDGGVECWGSGASNGQLGDGTTMSSNYPVKVAGLGGKAISLSSGTSFTCALLSNGKINCWGYNSSGELGGGDADPHDSVVEVAGIDSAVTIAAGRGFACATLSQGTGTCWGAGTAGQLGNSAQVNSLVPVPVKNLTGVMDIDTGTLHACALTTSGAVSCWGRNSQHQLGAGVATTGVMSTPTLVPDILPATSLSTHMAVHSCVTTTSGTVQCWGYNNNYQTGTTATSVTITAATVADLTDADTVLVGVGHSCAITTSGAIHCWGSSSLGRLGDTNPVGTAKTATPTTAAISDSAISASAGTNHTCATLSTGALECWGTNTDGELATGYSASITTPLTMPAISNKYTALAMGNDFACGLTSGGAVECWGGNYYGQLGNGTTTNSDSPLQVTGLSSGVTAVSAGFSHACAVKSDGGVTCWGNNLYGNLGNSTTAASTTPVAVTGLSSGVTAVSAGKDFTCARMSSGGVKCWGADYLGQLGNDSFDTSSTPVDVSGITDATSVIAGASTACAATTSAGVQCWGSAANGALGNISATQNTSHPVVVSNLTNNAAGVGVGANDACVIDEGKLKCWGYNAMGQVGNGTTDNADVPTEVTGLTSGIASVVVGYTHTCALTTSGSVKCWGINNYGQLGNATGTQSSTPIDVPGLSSGVSSLAVGYDSTCAVLTDGSVKCWGSNANNQLSMATAYSSTPLAPVGFDVSAVTVNSTSLAPGVAGTDYGSLALSATGGVTPYTWTATGLPSGMSISTDGTVSGTPTEAGTSEVTFTVTDVRGKTDSFTTSITITPAVHVTTTELPSVEAGDAYPETTLTAADGTPGYTWTSTTLPEGLTLTEAGVLSGTPTTAGDTTVTFTATDHNGKTATADLTITITAAAHLSSTLAIGVVGGDYTTTLTATGGTAPYTITATNLPNGLTYANGIISGTPTTTERNTPLQISITDGRGKTTTATPALTIVEPKTMSASSGSTCAITPAGSIECWGSNTVGQLGDGTTDNSSYPVPVLNLKGRAISVTVGIDHACALLSTGNVQCWGDNSAGELGTGDTLSSSAPADADITSAVSIVAGMNFTCATLRDGTASCWGIGTYGQIGNGSSENVSAPTAVSGLANVIDVEAGGSHACALTASGTVSCWGRNQVRQIGAGGSADQTFYNAPVAVPDVSDVISLNARMGAHTCVATSTGAVKCWGNNSVYQLGVTSPATSGDALTVTDVTDAVTVFAGGAHSCAVNVAGAMRCWGYNSAGQLGGGSIGTNSAAPISVSLADPVSGAVAGSSHTCARTTTGAIECWGSNSVGQLGNGTTDDTNTPTPVVGFNAAPLAVSSISLDTGAVGTAYPSVDLSATGGVAPYTWTATGLPNGMSLSSDGVLSGTPTESGTFDAAKITVTDVCGRTDSFTSSLTISPALTITTAALPPAVVNTDFTATMAATGGVGDYTWSAQDLPAGLTIDAATGSISGSATSPGTYDAVKITATDTIGSKAQSTLALPVTYIAGAASDLMSISANGASACAVTNTGGVKCWGANSSGLLGDGTTTNRSVATSVVGLDAPIKTVTVGTAHTCAITQAGGLRCWGADSYGQLGDGGTTNQSTPVTVPNVTNVTAVAVGTGHTCALISSGAVKCWGQGTAGQLGDGLGATSSTPVETGLTNAVAVSAGMSFSCALLSDGSARCWGTNNFRQLGDTTTTLRKTPATVVNVSNATSIASSATHSCVALSTGGVQCWGRNGSGQVGTGTTGTSSDVTTVSGLTGTAIGVAAGGGHSCALIENGSISCWGNNGSGQFGDGTTTTSLSPVSATMTDASEVTAGGNGNFTCALSESRDAFCWGANSTGQLGNGHSATEASPSTVDNLSSSVSAASTGLSHTCALTDSGTVQCWGYNANGELGNGTTTSSTSPVTVTISGGTALTGVAALASSDDNEFTCALTSSGGVYCWGANGSGQLGIGTVSAPNTTSSSVAVAVTGLDSGVKAISTGTNSTCAVTQAGTVQCWGNNEYGKLGDGTFTAKSYPVDVVGLNQITAVSVGANHACALAEDGSVKCWGKNSAGTLGDGTSTSSTAPVTVIGLSQATQITAGSDFTCAIALGGLKCWGSNDYGQLGIGGSLNAPVPTDVMGLSSGVSTVSAGLFHVCAASTDDTLRCWGYNNVGQLGVGDVVDRATPTLVSGIGATTSISAGYLHSCAVTASGTLQCWGSNVYTQLGSNTTVYPAIQTVLGIRS